MVLAAEFNDLFPAMPCIAGKRAKRNACHAAAAAAAAVLGTMRAATAANRQSDRSLLADAKFGLQLLPIQSLSAVN